MLEQMYDLLENKWLRGWLFSLCIALPLQESATSLHSVRSAKPRLNQHNSPSQSLPPPAAPSPPQPCHRLSTTCINTTQRHHSVLSRHIEYCHSFRGTTNGHTNITLLVHVCPSLPPAWNIKQKTNEPTYDFSSREVSCSASKLSFAAGRIKCL